MTLSVGSYYEIEVVELKPSGAVVKLKDGTTVFLHLSQISEKYVHSSSEYLAIGDTLSAIGVEGKVRPVELSVKYLNLPRKFIEHESNEQVASKRPTHKSNDFNKSRSHSRGGPPPEYKPSQQGQKSLDEMIASAQKSYQDKTRSLKKDTYYKPARRRRG